MAGDTASVQLTGGAGFLFEDKVAGFFLAGMAAGALPYGRDLGLIERLDWQTSSDGWRLDDLAISFAHRHQGKLALSIKSDRQVTRGGFPRSFVDAARHHWTSAAESDPFRRHRDLLGLVVGELAASVHEAWQNLLREASFADPGRVARRYSTAGASDATGRALLGSLGPHHLDVEPDDVLFARHVRLLHFDFTAVGSRSEGETLRMCQTAIASGDATTADALQQRLLAVASERRAAGGSITRDQLVDLLRGDFCLADHPDYASAWSQLERRSQERSSEVLDTAGGRVSLLRHEIVDGLFARLREGHCILLTGDGGTGKSAIAKRIAVHSRSFDRYVWLDGPSLDHPSMSDVEHALGLSTSLTTLIGNSPSRDSCLVIDGLETFTPAGRARLAQILKSLGPRPSLRGWTIIATTRPQAVEEARRLFGHSSMTPEKVIEQSVTPPSVIECTDVLSSVPRLNSILLGRELRDALRNLKLLDWILTDADQLGHQEVSDWLGLSDVIDSLWNRWVGGDATSAARSGVMKRLAAIEGEGVTHGVGLSDLEVAEHEVLGDLAVRDLVNVRDERVYFRHDMLGDWARLRLLVERCQDNPGVLNEYAGLPRWHDAIRLFGQRCLEQDREPPQHWCRQVDGLVGDAPPVVVARDLLLESLVLSARAEALVDRAWSALVADDGRLLRRMLKRFLFVATIPDPRIATVISDSEDIADYAPHWRFPWWPLWPSLLSALADHADEIARLAPVHAAQVSALWLRSIPLGTPSRRDAAAIALAVGRETQAARGEELRYYEPDEDKSIFEAALLASSEAPDDVAELCLQLARRRPDPPEVIARAEAHKERVRQEMAKRPKRPSAPMISLRPSVAFDRGPVRPQYPDGPAERVDDGIQRAVLDTQGVLALAAVRPDAAREVLLACSLEEPRRESPSDLGPAFDHLGVEEPHGYYPPMFFRGPWLQLIRQDPPLGIDCVVRLVNQATSTWERRSLPREPSEKALAATRVTVDIDSGQVEMVGDQQVFGWHRDRGCSAHLLVSALMALEKWLYEQLEQDASVDDAITQILRTGHSVAFLGVLTSVGKHRPQLLLRLLRPLLGVWQLYEWDLRLVMDGDLWQMGFFQWARSGDQVFNSVREWHVMPHRKKWYRQIANYLLLADADTREHFGEIRERWQREIDSGSCASPDSLELLIARFDPGNYELKTRDDGYVEAHFDWPDGLKQKTEASLAESAASQRLLSFPISCRQMLDKGDPLTADQAGKVWDALQEFEAQVPKEHESDFDVDRKPDALLAGIAVLKTLARDWLAEDPARERWCVKHIRQLLLHPPAVTVIDSEHSVSTDRWHSFLAEISVADLAAHTEEADARAFAAEALMSHWYATTSVSLKAAARCRNDLGDDFVRLMNLAVLWSALRCIRVPYEATDADSDIQAARRNRLIAAFVRGRIPAAMINWDAIGSCAFRAQERLHRKRFPEYGDWLDPEASPSAATVEVGSESDSQRQERPFSKLAQWLRLAFGWLFRRDRKPFPESQARIDAELPPTVSPAAAKTKARSQRRSRSHPGFDIECLRYAFSWLLPPHDAEPAEHRQEGIDWLRRLLSVTLSMLPQAGSRDDEEVSGTPYQYDRWVFDLTARTVARLGPEDAPEELWRPILELGPGAHYWIKDFLNAWTVSASREASSPERFFERWREMLEYATRSPIWMPQPGRRGFRLRELWENLLGMHLGASSIGVEEHSKLFGDLEPYYRQWADTFLDEDRSLRAFCRLLQEPGTKPLRCPAVPWLLRAAEQVHPTEWARDPIADEVAATLRLVWRDEAERVAGDPTLLRAFLALLNILVTQQSAVAMDLRDTFVRTVPTQT